MLGSHDLRVASWAAHLYLKGYAPFIVCNKEGREGIRRGQGGLGEGEERMRGGCGGVRGG